MLDVSLAMSIAIPLTVALSVELCGRQREFGFMLGLLVQTMNGIYGLVVGDWGWVLAWVITGPVFLRWYLKWRKKKRADKAGAGSAKASPKLRISVHSALLKVPGRSSRAPND